MAVSALRSRSKSKVTVKVAYLGVLLDYVLRRGSQEKVKVQNAALRAIRDTRRGHHLNFYTPQRIVFKFTVELIGWK